jgi:hypothetical protein
VAAQFTDEVVDFSRTIAYPGADPQVRPWRGRPFSATVRAVCGSCNNGWMSGLETQARPVLSALMRNAHCRLDAVEQHLVATWAVKTMLMLRLIEGDDDDRELDADMYRHLMQHGSPPPGEHVWVGSYAGEGQWPMTFHYLAAGIAPPGGSEPEHPNAYCASFAVGHLAVAVAGNRLAEGPVAVQRNPLDTWRLLWPALGECVEFPPPAALAGDSQMYAFALPLEWRAP